MGLRKSICCVQSLEGETTSQSFLLTPIPSGSTQNIDLPEVTGLETAPRFLWAPTSRPKRHATPQIFRFRQLS